MNRLLNRHGLASPLGFVFGLLLVFSVCFGAYAQQSGNNDRQFQVSGIVSDEAGNPIVGASIISKGESGAWTSTDEAGRFKIEAKKKDVLSISILGYEEKEVVVENGSPLDITLVEDVQVMDEAVVIGYGTVARRDHTGAVASVTGKQIEGRFFVSPEQILQGMVAGVQVTETSSEPGSTVSIRIRGTNSINSDNEPIYVVDGYVGADVDGINANDIQSMEVLKDASATAIYGSRGANGVIIITTKQGQAGKPVISYDLKYGFSRVSKKIDMADASEYYQFHKDKGDTGDLDKWKTPEEWAAIGKGTDWQDEVFQLGHYQNHQLSIRGGAKGTTYAVSGSIMNQVGNVINSYLNKGTLRTNITQQINDRIKFTLNSTLARSEGNRATVNSTGATQDGATVLNALRMAPFIPVYNEDGSYTLKNDFPHQGETAGRIILEIGNPVAYARLVRNSISSLSGSVNGILTIDLLPGLKWKSSAGTSFSRLNTSEYIPNSTYEGSLKAGQSTDNKNGSGNVLTEHTLTYDKTLARKHKINAVAGFTYQSFHSDSFAISAREFFSDTVNGYDISNAGVISDYSSGKNASSIMSYLGRINYSYDSRYVFTLTGRADGSSKFAKGHRWGYFPAAAFAWNIDKEKFMSGANWLDELKFRLSYGISGNQEIGNFKSMYFLSTGQYQFFNTKYVSLAPSQIGNVNLEWEKTLNYNIGLDYLAFNNRLGLNVDAYYKKTYDMLSEKRLPESSGFQSAMVNIGDVENKGLEVSLLSRNFISKREDGFFWETRVNYAMNRNKILRLGENNEDLYVGTSSSNLSTVGTTAILRVGEPIGSFYGCIYEGVWRDQAEIDEAVANGLMDSTAPGDPKFKDQDGDGYINEKDRVINGYAYPKFTLSLNNSFSYKNFSLDIFIYGSYGNSVFNLNRYYLESFSQYNKPRYYLRNKWTEENPDGIYPRSGTPKMRQTPGAASLYVEDASFIRLKNVTLGYSVPSRLLGNTFVRSLRVYATGDNLFTLSNYTGYDPEVNSFGKSNTSLATDRGAYPKYRSLIFGLSIGF